MYNFKDNFNIASYQSAREEIIQRIKLRDNALKIYLTIIISIFGLVLSCEVNPKILFTIPFLGLSFSFIVFQHHLVIRYLSYFLKEEFKSPLKHWDNSDIFEKFGKNIIFYRLLSQGVILVLPQILSLIYYLPCNNLDVIIWVLGFFAFIGSVLIPIKVNKIDKL